MYMFYILKYYLSSKPSKSLGKSYILATDADIKFRRQASCRPTLNLDPAAKDLTALLMMLARDQKVGAVCGRTYPMYISSLLLV